MITAELIVEIIRLGSGLLHFASNAVKTDAKLAAEVKALHAKGETFGVEEMDAALDVMRASRPAP